MLSVGGIVLAFARTPREKPAVREPYLGLLEGAQQYYQPAGYLGEPVAERIARELLHLGRVMRLAEQEILERWTHFFYFAGTDKNPAV